jgi:hypothetical protein
MSSEHRLRRLRELLNRIEQLPASSETERMLREVRARVVDVDTGVTPRPMLPVDPEPMLATDPGPPIAHAPKTPARPPVYDDGGRREGPPPERRKPAHTAPREDVSRSSGCIPTAGLAFDGDRAWLSLVATHKILSLDDSAPLLPGGEARAGHDRRPWRRGLRG